jgi:HEAT repeat protein
VRLGIVVVVSLLVAGMPDGAGAQTAPASVSEPVYDGHGLSEWVSQLTDRAPAVRSHAAYVMAELGPAAAPAVSALRAALRDEDSMVRYSAAWALSEIGPAARAAIPELQLRADEDPVGDVRWIAAKALRKLGVPAARPAPE